MALVDSGLHLGQWARALLGLAEGPINIGSIATINKWFPTQEKGRRQQASPSSIGIIAPAFVPHLCMDHPEFEGWRTVVYVFAILVFSNMLLRLFVRDNLVTVKRMLMKGSLLYRTSHCHTGRYKKRCLIQCKTS